MTLDGWEPTGKEGHHGYDASLLRTRDPMCGEDVVVSVGRSEWRRWTDRGHRRSTGAFRTHNLECTSRTRWTIQVVTGRFTDDL